ncbi:MAG TPA: hypothetical protein PLQ93_08830 [Bacteroidia bacterium]|nr:hypothetical protein [Bacteroidia bacterium]
MEDKTLRPEESLALIQGLMTQAKNKLADNGFYIILWGWLVFSASVLTYVSLLLGSDLGSLSWPVLMPLGAIVTLVYSRKSRRNDKVRTYVEHYLTFLWIAFGIALSLCLIMMGKHGLEASYFFLMLLYGMATFISGGLLNFRPLIIGGIFSFAIALLSAFVEPREVLLCLALSMLSSYIIPGHLLQARYKSENHVQGS